jgi:hypothetical protein
MVGGTSMISNKQGVFVNIGKFVEFFSHPQGIGIRLIF